MLAMLTIFHTTNTYTGCRTFYHISQLTGISLDLVNFLICQLVAFFLASTFRTILHPSKTSAKTRHSVALLGGLMISLFCYGIQALHILIMPMICLIIMRVKRPEVVQIWVMALAMSYLLVIHILRQIYTNGTDMLDVTGPLMVITQKVTNLAFNIHDGNGREAKVLTRRQGLHVVRKMPSVLEYFSYVLHFHVILSGPVIFYTDYIEFIEGANIRKHSPPNVIPQPTSTAQIKGNFRSSNEDPSPKSAIMRKCIGSIICGYIYMNYAKEYPIRRITCPIFLKNTNILEKFWYIIMATTCFRFKFYHAWLMSDAICNNSGLGFAGYDEAGIPKWNLVSNIDVLGFELSTNMREAINCWNLGTNQWLRYIVYDRTSPDYSTSLTFALSAVWHGFYPGYYITFATGALMVTAARKARRMFRHHFQQSIFSRVFYDFLTFLTTRCVMAYTAFPFMLLEFTGSFNMYLKLYLCLHVIALFVIYVLPKFLQTANFVEPSEVSNRATAGKIKVSNIDRNTKPYYGAKLTKPSLQTHQVLNNDSTSISPNTFKYPIAIQDIDVGILRTTISDSLSHSQQNVAAKRPYKSRATNMNKIMGTKLIKEKCSIASSATNVDPLLEREKMLGGNGGRVVFLKKELKAIKAAVQHDNMLPAMLSNGHGAK